VKNENVHVAIKELSRVQM